MRIGYLIPEFPAQTHNFFWNERKALHKIGIETYIISTRNPAQSLVSHAWAPVAREATTYLTEFGSADIWNAAFELLRVGPRAWIRATSVALDGCPGKQVPYNLALVFFAARLVGVMRKAGITHVHSHSCGNAALIAAMAHRMAGITYSLTLHGDLIDYGKQQNVKFRHAAFAITITKKLCSQIEHTLLGDSPRKIGLAPMGVDANIFRRSGPYEPWRQGRALHLFSCGRLNYVKGHQDLIEAVGLLRKQGVEARLRIAGEDDMGGVGFRQHLTNLIQRLDLSNAVTLLGAVAEDRILGELNEAHLFVLASHHEPLGVAIMEAMSFETPVVATNQGGVPELIDHGVDGYLVAPQDPAVLAGAIWHVANDSELSTKLSRAGRRKVLQKFGTDISAVTLKQLITACVSAPMIAGGGGKDTAK